MEARQRAKLSLTNRSFGLIALIVHVRPGRGPAPERTWHRQTRRHNDEPGFAGLVALARGANPIPFRTRPSNPSAPMVLCLKARESRSLPGLPNPAHQHENILLPTRNANSCRKWRAAQADPSPPPRTEPIARHNRRARPEPPARPSEPAPTAKPGQAGTKRRKTPNTQRGVEQSGSSSGS